MPREDTKARFHVPGPHAPAQRLKKLRSRKATIANPATRLDREVETLAKSLQRDGYVTGHFGKWHLGPEPYSPLEHGFGSDLPHWSGPGPAGSYVAPWQFPKELNFLPNAANQHLEDRMVAEAVAFMEQHQDEPFFLNYWAFSVHAPFDAKPKLVEKYAAKVQATHSPRSPVYAAMVQSFDEAVGKLLDALDRLGLAERTVVVFFSDNGGSTFDRIKGVPATSNAPLRGGKAEIYEGGIHVPAAVIWPGHIVPRSRSSAFLSSSDWYPTLLEMLDVEKPAGHVLDGVSQVPALLKTGMPRSSVYCFLPHYFPIAGTVPATSVRTGRFKLIRFHHDGEGQRDRFELYDLAADPGERNNLATRQRERVKSLDREISRYLSHIGALVPKRNLSYVPPLDRPTRLNGAR